MSKVVLIGIISVIFVLMVLILGSVYVYPWWMQRSTEGACAQITKDNAIDTVTRDYMENRIPNWGNDKDNMGTSVPVLNFISDDVKEDKGTYNIPFSAKGPNGTLGYVAHFNCSNHYVKYSTVE